MSLSRKNDKNKNPAVKFYQWGGSEGNLKCYNKETEELTYVDCPVSFIKLDQLSTVTGWSDEKESYYYSNEVRSLNQEELIIWAKKKLFLKGVWGKIKDEFKAEGGKFAISLYVAELNDDGSYELCNLKLFGASITPWIEFSKSNNNPGFTISGSTEAKKGSNKYYVPIFEEVEISDEQREEAIKLDENLQNYLDEYFNYASEYDSDSEDLEEDVVDEKEDKPKAKSAKVESEIPF